MYSEVPTFVRGNLFSCGVVTQYPLIAIMAHLILLEQSHNAKCVDPLNGVIGGGNQILLSGVLLQN